MTFQPPFEILYRRINNADYRADLPCNMPLEYELDATPPACTPDHHRNLPIGGRAEHQAANPFSLCRYNFKAKHSHMIHHLVLRHGFLRRP